MLPLDDVSCPIPNFFLNRKRKTKKIENDSNPLNMSGRRENVGEEEGESHNRPIHDDMNEEGEVVCFETVECDV